MDIYSNFPHCYPVPAPINKIYPRPLPPRNKWAIYSIDNSCWNNIIALSDGYANVPFFQRIGEMVQNIFTNALRKIFVKGSMHLIYERNLILFNNPLFQAIDARTN